MKALFEQQKIDELLKYYTEDVKFIMLPINQTLSGREGLLSLIDLIFFFQGLTVHSFQLIYPPPHMR